ncbi:ESX secretion-associated protein EspG [Allosaccharopolyspora coralli]|uniref:ESX secretion-associated protein EspG n=1 Tax=Allosaccharopolyspora coralli TaxID=2665642 RepID=A0A5Q3Q9S3_9PSEU|nr:ESX secretion-associated protein EspG [Allosaccharopolyspora coralli]QGK68235.1 ESX secretion-associated protein EspG [Allosaccharopolyspora coralli]
MAGGEITLSPHAAMFLSERMDLVPHPMLRVGRLPVSATEEDRLAATDEGRNHLRSIGLMDHNDLEPVVEDAWYALSRPPLAVGLATHSSRGPSYNAVFVDQGRTVLRARQADADDTEDIENIVLSRNNRVGLASNVTDTIGDLAPGRGASVSVPNEQIEQARRRAASGSGMQQAFSAARISRNDAQTLTDALSNQRTTEGVVTVRAYDERVRRVHKLPYNVQYFSNDTGSYTMEKKAGRDGREWFTLAPTDSRKLAAKVDEMVNELRR